MQIAPVLAMLSRLPTVAITIVVLAPWAVQQQIGYAVALLKEPREVKA
jgi:hypothetical protein